MSDHHIKSNDKIRLAVSSAELKNKVSINIADPKDPVYWYMRFNIPLDESSVSEKTMTVTDTDGYIMRVDISYDPKRNMIVISPLDSYEQGTYYILSVSTKVRSSKGQNLKSKIHIVFKLLNNEISEYRVLRSDTKVSPPRKRPKDYEQMRETKAKLYSFDKDAPPKEFPSHTVQMADVGANLFVPIAGVAVLGAGFFAFPQAFYIAATVALAAFSFFIYQLLRPARLSSLIYNVGALAFNKGKYKFANKMFAKALQKDENNELAEYALNKSEFYIEE